MVEDREEEVAVLRNEEAEGNKEVEVAEDREEEMAVFRNEEAEGNKEAAGVKQVKYQNVV